jgi:predicted alpha/beta-fold hydrolase
MAIGCFQERSLPVQPGDVFRIEINQEQTTRQWLSTAHTQLKTLLKSSDRPALLTEDLSSPGCDVYAQMGRDPKAMRKVFGNLRGTMHTAQCVGATEAIAEPAPPWPGFQQVRIPVDDGVELIGRLGIAQENGQAIQSNCVVLLPGYMGDNAILRTRDLAAALCQNGLHALALELRGHGQTERCYPDVYYTFGIIETQDLLHVSRWLKEEYECVRNTGLIGFCWGGNLGMLAAWMDGAGANHPSVSPYLARFLEVGSVRRHYTAGVIAFSPVLRWEELVERTDIRHSMLADPFTNFFQNTIRRRAARKGFSDGNGSLRMLIDHEYQRSVFGPNLPIRQAYRFLRWLPHRGMPADDKLSFVRVPLLLAAGVNDPFFDVQDIADMMATTDNSSVAALILDGGGHAGFAAYNRAYYYSLIVNFFDPETGAAVAQRD